MPHIPFVDRITKTNKIKDELRKTVGDSKYNGWINRGEYGYHSYNLEGIKIPGQRDPKFRLDEFRKYIGFKNKIVVDFGCNVGAMLHHLPEIKAGIGFDYDPKCIEAAQNISKILGITNLEFKLHDFDKETYESLNAKIDVKPDIVFLLSLGSWIKSWQELYSLALEIADTIVLEVNNMEEGQAQLDFFKGYSITEILSSSADDATGNNRRKTFVITKK